MFISIITDYRVPIPLAILILQERAIRSAGARVHTAVGTGRGVIRGGVTVTVAVTVIQTIPDSTYVVVIAIS